MGTKTLTFGVLQDTMQGGRVVYSFWQIGSSEKILTGVLVQSLNHIVSSLAGTPNVNGNAVLTTRATFVLDSGSGLVIVRIVFQLS